MNKIYFILGEDKKVRLRIHATDNAPFSFQTAEFSLLSRGDLISRGSCEIDDHLLICQISPPVTGYYVLEITYQIANETFKDRIEVQVS